MSKTWGVSFLFLSVFATACASASQKGDIEELVSVLGDESGHVIETKGILYPTEHLDALIRAIDQRYYYTQVIHRFYDVDDYFDPHRIVLFSEINGNNSGVAIVRENDSGIDVFDVDLGREHIREQEVRSLAQHNIAYRYSVDTDEVAIGFGLPENSGQQTFFWSLDSLALYGLGTLGQNEDGPFGYFESVGLTHQGAARAAECDVLCGTRTNDAGCYSRDDCVSDCRSTSHLWSDDEKTLFSECMSEYPLCYRSGFNCAGLFVKAED